MVRAGDKSTVESTIGPMLPRWVPSGPVSGPVQSGWSSAPLLFGPSADAAPVPPARINRPAPPPLQLDGRTEQPSSIVALKSFEGPKTRSASSHNRARRSSSAPLLPSLTSPGAGFGSDEVRFCASVTATPCTSLHRILHGGLGGLVSPSDPSRLPAPMSQQELSKLSPVEALRRLFVEHTGSLRVAQATLDEQATFGELDQQAFTKSLRVLGIRSGSVPGFTDRRSLFEHLAEGGEKVSVELMIGTIPDVSVRAASKGAGDTSSMWTDYHKKTLAHSSDLTRVPRWLQLKEERPCSNLPPIGTKSGGDKPDWGAEQAALEKRRRNFRKQFRENRTNMDPDRKRNMVLGGASCEDPANRRVLEQVKIENSGERIQGAIRGCRKARHQLIDMQKMMAALGGSGSQACGLEADHGLRWCRPADHLIS